MFYIFFTQEGLEGFTTSKTKALLKHTLSEYLHHKKERPKQLQQDSEDADDTAQLSKDAVQNTHRNLQLTKVPKIVDQVLKPHHTRYPRNVKEAHISRNEHKKKDTDSEPNKDQDLEHSKDFSDEVQLKEKGSRGSKQEVAQEEEIILPVEETSIPPVQKSSFGE